MKSKLTNEKLTNEKLVNYLRDAVICKKAELDYMKVDVSSSKPDNWVFDLPESAGKLFVKQTPERSSLKNDGRLHKEWQIYNFLQSEKDFKYASSLTPEVRHFDETNSILIYEVKNNYISLDSYYKEIETFPNSLAEIVGITLAKVHSETMNSQKCRAFRTELVASKLQYQLPYPDYLSDYLISHIEPESLKKSPAHCWRFIGNFQQAEAVREVVRELVLNHHHCCLTHNNIQFTKIFIPREWEKLLSSSEDAHKSLIKLVDWEASSWGDPACDLGKAILGYFSFWINSAIVHPDIEIKTSLQLATIPLEVVRPSFVAMTKAYINTYPKILEDYPDFLKRVIQFAGLGLIYRLMAEFQSEPEMALSHQSLYFFIAAQLLCRPEKFLSI